MSRTNDSISECDRAGGELPKLTLFHFTSEEAASDIFSTGFLPGDDGLVWFAEHPTKVWAASTMSLLLEIQVWPEVVQPFRVVLEEDEWDSISKQWVKSTQSEGLIYFALPPDIANRYSPRRLADEERRLLMI